MLSYPFLAFQSFLKSGALKIGDRSVVSPSCYNGTFLSPFELFPGREVVCRAFVQLVSLVLAIIEQDSNLEQGFAFNSSGRCRMFAETRSFVMSSSAICSLPECAKLTYTYIRSIF